MKKHVFVSYQFNVGSNSVNFGCMGLDLDMVIMNWDDLDAVRKIIENKIIQEIPHLRGEKIRVVPLFWRNFEESG